ncbi:hypothetical protein PR048_020534 [Dryococelus australis]|uniref:Uncharacterized protein n=1 Tax=Dryococelus australis TaxID=614101 RepID=A0ABQ9H6K5_9NEOP|nr:hypothetical protein PR048_020534 [Dryococelus australis]
MASVQSIGIFLFIQMSVIVLYTLSSFTRSPHFISSAQLPSLPAALLALRSLIAFTTSAQLMFLVKRSVILPWATVYERLDCSPPIKANRVQDPDGSLPDYRTRESCRTMPFVGGVSQRSPVFHGSDAVPVPADRVERKRRKENWCQGPCRSSLRHVIALATVHIRLPAGGLGARGPGECRAESGGLSSLVVGAGGPPGRRRRRHVGHCRVLRLVVLDELAGRETGWRRPRGLRQRRPHVLRQGRPCSLRQRELQPEARWHQGVGVREEGGVVAEGRVPQVVIEGQGEGYARAVRQRQRGWHSVSVGYLRFGDGGRLGHRRRSLLGGGGRRWRRLRLAVVGGGRSKEGCRLQRDVGAGQQHHGAGDGVGAAGQQRLVAGDEGVVDARHLEQAGVGAQCSRQHARHQRTRLQTHTKQTGDLNARLEHVLCMSAPDQAGATVAERLARSPPTKATRVQSPAGSLRIFACGNRAGRYRSSAGILGDLPFPPPLHSDATPY